MGKTTLHWQRIGGWAAGAQDALGCRWVKIVNPPPGPDPFPGRAKCLRFHTDDWDRPLLAQGQVGADAFFARMWPIWQQFLGWGDVAFSGPNEPPCNGNEELAALNEFWLRMIWHGEQHGLTLVILDLSEGNPHDNGTGDPGVSRWKVQQLAACVKAAVAGGHLIGLHGYWRMTSS